MSTSIVILIYHGQGTIIGADDTLMQNSYSQDMWHLMREWGVWLLKYCVAKSMVLRRARYWKQKYTASSLGVKCACWRWYLLNWDPKYKYPMHSYMYGCVYVLLCVYMLAMLIQVNGAISAIFLGWNGINGKF